MIQIENIKGWKIIKTVVKSKTNNEFHYCMLLRSLKKEIISGAVKG